MKWEGNILFPVGRGMDRPSPGATSNNSSLATGKTSNTTASYIKKYSK